MSEQAPQKLIDAQTDPSAQTAELDEQRARELGAALLQPITRIIPPVAKPKIGNTRPSENSFDASSVAFNNMYYEGVDVARAGSIPSDDEIEAGWQAHENRANSPELVAERAATNEADKDMEHTIKESMTDRLTGLPNREALEEFAKKVGIEGITGVINFDSVDFKSVNDKFGGHRVGNQVLQQTTGILIEELGDLVMLARLGGDEFGGIIYGGSSLEEVKERAERAKQRMSDEIVLQRVAPKTEDDMRDEYRGGISVGIAPSNTFSTLEDGLELADQAMYVDKQKDHLDGNVPNREARRQERAA